MAVAACAAPLCGVLIDRGHGRSLLTGGALCGGAAVWALRLVRRPAHFYALWYTTHPVHFTTHQCRRCAFHRARLAHAGH